jgi:hypothetical protein
LNSDEDIIHEKFYVPFHYTEFWAAFLFTLVEAFILVSAGIFSFKRLLDKLMMLVVGFNVVASFVAALIFTFEPHLFEEIAHYIEYGAQITITLANFIFIIQTKKEVSRLALGAQLTFAVILVIMAILKLLFFTGAIYSPMGGERSSHFFEFTGEAANSLWAFVYALQQFLVLTDSQERHNDSLKDD